MKNLYTLLLSILLALPAMSQGGENASNNDSPDFSGFRPGAGNIMAEGNVGFSTSKDKFDGDEVNSSFGLGLDVSAQYFLDQNMSFGLGLGYNQQKSTSTDQVTGEDIINRQSSFSIGPVGRYTFNPVKDLFQPYAQLAIPIGFGGSETESDGNTSEGPDTFSLGVSLSAGIIFYPTDCLGIQLSSSALQYTSTTLETDAGDSTTNTFDLDLMRKSWMLGVCFVY